MAYPIPEPDAPFDPAFREARTWDALDKFNRRRLLRR
jgi:hypothetical protein